MKRIQRLIEAREREREAAARELDEARQLLEDLKTKQSRAQGQSHAMASGQRDITAADLEQLDAVQKNANRAIVAGQSALKQAQIRAVEAQRQLRQIELLYDRLLSKHQAESAKHERRQADEVASRMRDRLLILVTIGLLSWLQNGCQGETHAATPERPAAAETPRSKNNKGSNNCPPTSFDAAELAILGKLRARREAITKRANALSVREAEIAIVEERVKKMIGELKRLQERTDANESESDDTEQETTVGAQDATGQSPNDTSDLPLDPVDLVAVLKDMNARAASAMLAQMAPEKAAEALRHLTPPHVAKLLALMPAENSARIGARLPQLAPKPHRASRRHNAAAAGNQGPLAKDETPQRAAKPADAKEQSAVSDTGGKPENAASSARQAGRRPVPPSQPSPAVADKAGNRAPGTAETAESPVDSQVPSTQPAVGGQATNLNRQDNLNATTPNP